MCLQQCHHVRFQDTSPTEAFEKLSKGKMLYAARATWRCQFAPAPETCTSRGKRDGASEKEGRRKDPKLQKFDPGPVPCVPPECWCERGLSRNVCLKDLDKQIYERTHTVFLDACSFEMLPCAKSVDVSDSLPCHGASWTASNHAVYQPEEANTGVGAAAPEHHWRYLPAGWLSRSGWVLTQQMFGYHGSTRRGRCWTAMSEQMDEIYGNMAKIMEEVLDCLQ